MSKCAMFFYHTMAKGETKSIHYMPTASTWRSVAHLKRLPFSALNSIDIIFQIILKWALD